MRQGDVPSKDGFDQALATSQRTGEKSAHQSHHRPDEGAAQAGLLTRHPGKQREGCQQAAIERDAQHSGQQT